MIGSELEALTDIPTLQKHIKHIQEEFQRNESEKTQV